MEMRNARILTLQGVRNICFLGSKGSVTPADPPVIGRGSEVQRKESLHKKDLCWDPLVIGRGSEIQRKSSLHKKDLCWDPPVIGRGSEFHRKSSLHKKMCVGILL